MSSVPLRQTQGFILLREKLCNYSKFVGGKRYCNCKLLALMPIMNSLLLLGCVSTTRRAHARVIKDCNASKDLDMEGTKQGTLFLFVIIGYMLILL